MSGDGVAAAASWATWTAGLLLALDALIRVGLSVRVVTRRWTVSTTLSWLVLVLALPFAGAVLYLLVGENRLGRARVKDHADRPTAAPPPTEPPALPRRHAAVAQHAQAAFGVALRPDNRLELLDHTQAPLARIVADIDGARHACDLEFYIWFAGGEADAVADALRRAASRGVRCRVLLDAVGSRGFLRSPAAGRLRDAGVRVVACLPAGPLRALFRRIDLRNHRKLVVVDATAAWTGSLNMIDPRYFKRNAGVGEWVDAMVRVEGPAVADLGAVFENDWRQEAGDEGPPPPDAASPSAPPPPTAATPADPPAPAGSRLQVIDSGPSRPAASIQRLLLTAIYTARERVTVTTPYFVPDESLLIALTTAATRGVAVTVIVPGRSDSRLARLASQAYYDELLAAGVRIARYRAGLLHTKSVVIDDGFSAFGTVNLDMRSFYLNFELTLLVYDRGFADRLGTLQARYLEKSDPVDADAWRERGHLAHLLDQTVRLLGPVL